MGERMTKIPITMIKIKTSDLSLKNEDKLLIKNQPQITQIKINVT
jgi:hypothetical protein